jgi:hypothetical protein
MKRIARTILLILFTLYANGSPVAWVVYAFQADSIAAAYCVNPTNPACHGKCHVNTASNEQRKGSAPSDRVMLEKSLPAPFVLSAPSYRIASTTEFLPPDGADIMAGHPASIYHPPPFRS